MTVWQAVVLGFVQGCTEWLPISSTAHLRIVPAVLGWPDPGASFTAMVQSGTLVAALVYFRRDILGVFGLRAARGSGGRGLLLPILVGTIPVVAAGSVLQAHIEGAWRSLYVVAGALVVFGALLAFAEARYRTRPARRISVADGLLVGLGQAFSLVPGVSRSGATLTASLLLGLERSAAARLSFLLSLPATSAAGLKECWDARSSIVAAELGPLAISTAVAFLVGLASIHWLVSFLCRNATYGFAVYRAVLAAAILVLVACRVLPAH